ncbi:open rectifier potassium channel protein 1 [Cimex lectularius]|uniref:Potassium channel domain-containing protein n=1 Tax=Cimex lectularius TaxID=79782 RepID=A0A8I6R7G5_CIMLE|nr:open rectifier potassium channel protein 1 [Cimex lectularius]XP_014239893.1 open rectifier potassium channel protein 1 [Cimex lectularius]
MSKTEWLVLFLLFIAYLFLGASIFYKIERDLEEEKRGQAEADQKYLRELLTKQYMSINNDVTVNDLAMKLSVYCKDNFAKILEVETNSTEVEPEPYTWTFYNAFFFALTTLSTIGYGNLKPSTDMGRIIMIFYALFGIPFNGIVLAQMGEFFGSVFLRAHHRYKNHVYVSKINLLLDILIYLIPGMVIFIIAPTFLFQYFENWTFCESIYYAFVTLTTIGFGDLVAGQSTDDSPGDTAYKIFLLIWIMFGLGYLVMILGFIARAMKSKKLNRIERKLANTLKQTHNKIWHEFIEDINYLRRALNETYINKVKPIYKDKKPLLNERRLTVSMPDLTEWPQLRRKSEIERMQDTYERIGGIRRRRAFSEHDNNFQVEESLPRVMSEGALGDIDKIATFRDKPRPSLAAIDHETEELLANIVNQRRLSVYEDPTDNDGGIHLFTDDEILHSEQYNTKNSSSSWTPKRSRAVSEVQYLPDSTLGYDRQKTWAGVDTLHTRTMLKNMKSKEGDWESGEQKESKQENGFRRLSIAAMNFFSGERKKKLSKDKPKKERRTGNTFSRTNSTHRFSLQENEPRYVYDDVNFYTQNNRRPSLLDVLPSAGTGNSTPMSPVLEQTSIADFLRVMSTLKKLEEEQGSSPTGNRSRHPSLSYLFNPQPLPKELLRTREASASTGNLNKERRFSQGLPRPEQAAHRRRAISMSRDINKELPRNSQAGGRFTPPTRALNPPIPPTVVVTSPDGHHRFSVHNVASQRNENLLGPKRRGENFSETISRQ